MVGKIQELQQKIKKKKRKNAVKNCFNPKIAGKILKIVFKKNG